MIAVISEVWPHAARKAEYFRLSEELRPHLQSIDGFISSERFESCSGAGKYVSVSFWRDKAALERWRKLEEHRLIMAKGRDGILRDYHIHVTEVLWDYSMTNRAGSPLGS